MEFSNVSAHDIAMCIDKASGLLPQFRHSQVFEEPFSTVGIRGG